MTSIELASGGPDNLRPRQKSASDPMVAVALRATGSLVIAPSLVAASATASRARSARATDESGIQGVLQWSQLGAYRLARIYLESDGALRIANAKPSRLLAQRLRSRPKRCVSPRLLLKSRAYTFAPSSSKLSTRWPILRSSQRHLPRWLPRRHRSTCAP